MAQAIDQGRAAFAARQWRTAYAHLSAADAEGALEPADLERLAAAAYLVGEDERAVALWTRVHHDWIDRGDAERAAYWGYWLAFVQLLGGEPAQATGWLARAQRLDKAPQPGAARGYGEVLHGLLALASRDAAGATARFDAAVALAEKFDDPDLLALGLLGQGQALVVRHAFADGAARLDEAMLGITAGRVSPVLAGVVYCAVILTCQRFFDLARAREWTRQLDAWCAAQPDLSPFRGECLVHRSQILQSRGDWPGALGEAAKARDHLAGRSEAVVGRACYQQGELHRLRGELDAAERMYRDAGRHGCEPQPGMSLLRLAKGEADAAAAAIRLAVEVAVDVPGPAGGLSRPRLLGPQVEILLALGDVAGARKAADALAAIAAEMRTPWLAAASAHGGRRGAARRRRSAGRAGAAARSVDAVAAARDAFRIGLRARAARRGLPPARGPGNRAHAPRSRARRVRAPRGRACARRARAIERGKGGAGARSPARARGAGAASPPERSNREIAARLAISEHTVARHVSNIFDKLGVSSRAAAGHYAHLHKLV